MTDTETLLALASDCERAAAAFERVLNMDGPPATQAAAAALILSLHGELFGKAAAALKARALAGRVE